MAEQITTPEALDALPRRTVGHDALGQVCERAFGGPGFVWRMTGTTRKYEAAGINLPFTVLYRPDTPAPSAEDREALADHLVSLGLAEEKPGYGHATGAEVADAAFVWFASRQPETTTEWGVRWPGGVERVGAPGTDDDYEDGYVTHNNGVRVSREVTAWKEVRHG